MDGEWQDLKIKFESTFEASTWSVTERGKSSQMPTWLLQQSLAPSTALTYIRPRRHLYWGLFPVTKAYSWGRICSHQGLWLLFDQPVQSLLFSPYFCLSERAYICSDDLTLDSGWIYKRIQSHPISSASPASFSAGKKSNLAWSTHFVWLILLSVTLLVLLVCLHKQPSLLQ